MNKYESLPIPLPIVNSNQTRTQNKTKKRWMPFQGNHAYDPSFFVRSKETRASRPRKGRSTFLSHRSSLSISFSFYGLGFGSESDRTSSVPTIQTHLTVPSRIQPRRPSPGAEKDLECFGLVEERIQRGIPEPSNRFPPFSLHGRQRRWFNQAGPTPALLRTRRAKEEDNSRAINAIFTVAGCMRVPNSPRFVFVKKDVFPSLRKSRSASNRAAPSAQGTSPRVGAR